MAKLKLYHQEILDKFLSNQYTIKELAEEYQVNYSSIARFLHKNGVETNRNSRFHFNQDYFETIDTEHKAYWLGFLYADGYVNSKSNTVSLRLKENDDYILKQFAEDLESNIPVRYYSHTHKLPNSEKEHTFKYASLTICNAKIKEDLIGNGCFENKTFILSFPFWIPQHLYVHFIRGYIDGDGCITYHGKQKCGVQRFKVSICGTKEILEGIQKVFGLTTKLGKRWKDDKNNYDLTISGNHQVYTFLNALYDNSTIHLKRKYDRYLELKNTLSLLPVMEDEINM